MTPTVTPTLTFHCPHCSAALQAAPTNADETTVCPTCQQSFTLAAPAPAQPAAPALILPPGVEAPPPAPVAAPVAEVPESPGEVVRVSLWRRYPGRCLLYVLALAACVAGGVWTLTQDYPVLAILCGGALAFVLFRLGTWWLRMHNTTLTITDRRCVIETGLFTRESTEIGRKDVTDVRVSQGPLMRILDVGDVVIRSNGGTHKEIVLMAVPHPDDVVRKIAPPPPAAPEATSAA